MTAPCDKCGHTHSTSLGGICVGCPCPEGGWNSPAPEPLGPALAAELGGEWDEHNQRVWLDPSGRTDAAWITETVFGDLVLHIRLGRHRDGVEALAAEARRLGVA